MTASTPASPTAAATSAVRLDPPHVVARSWPRNAPTRSTSENTYTPALMYSQRLRDDVPDPPPAPRLYARHSRAVASFTMAARALVMECVLVYGCNGAERR